MVRKSRLDRRYAIALIVQAGRVGILGPLAAAASRIRQAEEDSLGRPTGERRKHRAGPVARDSQACQGRHDHREGREEEGHRGQQSRQGEEDSFPEGAGRPWRPVRPVGHRGLQRMEEEEDRPWEGQGGHHGQLQRNSQERQR